MTDVDLTAWCQQSAAKYREYEHINMAAPPTPEDRDTAIVEWVVRVLGNPELPESREVLRLLHLRHPQDHATDVTVPGPVLTSEPGPEVTTVVDGDGDRWARRGGVWICADDADPLSWTDLSEIFGPIRSAL